MKFEKRSHSRTCQTQSPDGAAPRLGDFTKLQPQLASLYSSLQPVEGTQFPRPSIKKGSDTAAIQECRAISNSPKDVFSLGGLSSTRRRLRQHKTPPQSRCLQPPSEQVIAFPESGADPSSDSDAWVADGDGFWPSWKDGTAQGQPVPSSSELCACSRCTPREWHRDGKKIQSLRQGLIPLRASDEVAAVQYPTVTANGVHVFLDMSNIVISFRRTLQDKFAPCEGLESSFPRFMLHLDLLTEILVRSRRVVVLNAGCSVVPGKREPRYVQVLRDLGYHVDLRERRRLPKLPQDSGNTISLGSSTAESSVVPRGARYIEDLVDETLQTRIAESVMEHFQKQGTLVLATGDARPATYSDGFFAYAERALKMGWNVEVASWKTSLSSRWRSAEWVAKWGDRFRIIELDKFIDDLILCHS